VALISSIQSINLPTWITLSRLAGVPFILYSLQPGSGVSPWAALILFLVVAATDWLDGYLARRLNQVTELGKFLDPLVDKLLVLAPLLSFLVLGKIGVWGVFLILLRELTVAGWRVNQTQVTGANGWGKAKTISQIVAIALIMAPLPAPWPAIGQGAFALSVALTLISGALYLWPQSQA
jgi:CDP-diacylglycerol---glycerol-3-phosphate 3-phosphatidyltransferase